MCENGKGENKIQTQVISNICYLSGRVKTEKVVKVLNFS